MIFCIVHQVVYVRVRAHGCGKHLDFIVERCDESCRVVRIVRKANHKQKVTKSEGKYKLAGEVVVMAVKFNFVRWFISG